MTISWATEDGGRAPAPAQKPSIFVYGPVLGDGVEYSTNSDLEDFHKLSFVVDLSPKTVKITEAKVLFCLEADSTHCADAKGDVELKDVAVATSKVGASGLHKYNWKNQRRTRQ